MKLVFTVGSDAPNRGALAPFLKLAVVGLLALIVMNRSDIRRYMRLRRM